MKLVVATAPSTEPITLAEAKLHLRVDISDDDNLITALISAARIRCEAELGQSFVSTTWDYYLDRWDSRIITLPMAPVSSVTSITYYDATNALTTWSSAEYDPSTGSPGRITTAFGYAYPTPYDRLDAIKIRFVAGYGAASAVPENIKAAIKLELTNLYDHRGEDPSEVSPTVKALLAASAHGKYA